MRRVLWVSVVLALMGVLVYGSIFPVAEIFMEVVVLRTYSSDGVAHETRVTVVDLNGVPWVRGRPYRGWFQRIAADPTAELCRGGIWLPVRAVVSLELSDAVEFQQAALRKYGFAYRYVDLIARMYPNEVPVRLAARAPKAGEGTRTCN